MKILLKEFNSYPEASRAVYWGSFSGNPAPTPVCGSFQNSFYPPPVARRLKLIADLTGEHLHLSSKALLLPSHHRTPGLQIKVKLTRFIAPHVVFVSRVRVSC